ncbi:hypothetical protein DAI22_09g063650 [Oryza sativa Japonica Group]|nr:hypothetical protein DAI22_09g063650 [Oryza sativa Japonica Group]
MDKSHTCPLSLSLSLSLSPYLFLLFSLSISTAAPLLLSALPPSPPPLGERNPSDSAGRGSSSPLFLLFFSPRLSRTLPSPFSRVGGGLAVEAVVAAAGGKATSRGRLPPQEGRRGRRRRRRLPSARSSREWRPGRRGGGGGGRW